MALMLTTHMGATDHVNKPYVRFKKLTVLNRTWAKGKKWFRDALAENEDTEKAMGEDAGIYANAATRHKNSEASAEQRAREEIAEKLGESFETLACAATVKTTL